MKLDRRRFLGSTIGVGATAGMTVEWAWPKHSVSYRRPVSSVAVLNADEYSSHVLPHMQEAAAAQVEALLFDSSPKKRAGRKKRRTVADKTSREQK